VPARSTRTRHASRRAWHRAHRRSSGRGVADQDFDAPKPLDGGVEQRFDVARVRQIGPERGQPLASVELGADDAPLIFAALSMTRAVNDLDLSNEIFDHTGRA
jgi:hypothetical protein